jgi:endonuclease YncB( thermonuclease family)
LTADDHDQHHLPPADMSFRALVFVLAALVAAFVAGGAGGAPAAVVASVTDGDTLRLTNGQRVRLLQIDAPESGECYGTESRAALLMLAPVGSAVTLEVDPRLDRVDRGGRLLRYVRRGATNVNLELVRRGAAAPYFFRGERGLYAARLLAAAKSARAARRGLWSASPSTALAPDRQVETSCGSQPLPLVPPSGGCDPNYAGACVPRYPPDVDCGDLRSLGLALPVRVVGSDPHRLDGDGDGLGCEPPS